MLRRLQQPGGPALRVADVGCGGGMNLIEMARRFPGGAGGFHEFHGFELSKCALARARANAAAAAAEGVDMSRVFWHDVAEAGHSLEEVGSSGGAFDMVLCYDVLHDMAHPRALMAEVRAVLEPTRGVWLAVDIKCSPYFEENLQDPGAAIKFGNAVFDDFQTSW